MTAKMTKAQRAAYDRLFRTTQDLIHDFHNPAQVGKYLPDDWAHIPATAVADKVRVTLRVDADVARFFRKLGPGYQGTMNTVLRAFMLAKLADVLGEEPGGVEVEVTTDDAVQLAMAQEVSLQDEIGRMRRMRFGKLGERC